MAFWQARDFLFCGVCGTLLTFDSVRSASCPLCGFKRDAKEIEGKQIQYTMTAEDIRRGLKTPTEDIVVQRPTTNKTCPNCDHPEAEFYSVQMRSADEGETTFYTYKMRQKFQRRLRDFSTTFTDMALVLKKFPALT